MHFASVIDETIRSLTPVPYMKRRAGVAGDYDRMFTSHVRNAA